MCPFTEGKALHMSQLFSLEMAVGRHDEVEAGWIKRQKSKEKNAHAMFVREVCEVLWKYGKWTF